MPDVLQQKNGKNTLGYDMAVEETLRFGLIGSSCRF